MRHVAGLGVRGGHGGGETWRGYVAWKRGVAEGRGGSWGEEEAKRGAEQPKGRWGPPQRRRQRLGPDGGMETDGRKRRRWERCGRCPQKNKVKERAVGHEQEEQEAQQKRTAAEKGQRKEGGSRAEGRASPALRHFSVATERMGGTGIRAARARGRDCVTVNVWCRACSRAKCKCCAFGGSASVGLACAMGRIPRKVGRGSDEPVLGAADCAERARRAICA